MSKNELATTNLGAELVEKVVVDGDLAKLSSEERLHYYKSVCDSVGLNPLTKPFEYIRLNGKLRLYALKGATDQLRAIHGISIVNLEKDYVDDLIVVTATAKDSKGRVDSDTGAVSLGSLKGEARANAIMKAITKAKRRVTLSMVGLGMLDETEVDSIPNAEPVSVEVAHDGYVTASTLDELETPQGTLEEPVNLHSEPDTIGEDGAKKLIGMLEKYRVGDPLGFANLMLDRRVNSLSELSKAEGNDLYRIAKEAAEQEKGEAA